MKLHHYKIKHAQKVANYTLTEEQLRFTGSPQESVMLAAEDLDRKPILAFEGEALVTFLVLHLKTGAAVYSNNPNAALIRAFSTDFYQQGKGYAKEVLNILPSYVKQHYPEVNELVLAVNEKNRPAQHLYAKCHFKDTGRRYEGPKGPQIVMDLHF